MLGMRKVVGCGVHRRHGCINIMTIDTGPSVCCGRVTHQHVSKQRGAAVGTLECAQTTDDVRDAAAALRRLLTSPQTPLQVAHSSHNQVVQVRGTTLVVSVSPARVQPGFVYFVFYQ